MDLPLTRFVDTVVLAPAGRIDHGSAEGFKDALRPHLERCAAARDQLVLDLSGVDYISSAGLRVLLLAAKRLQPQGRLVLCSLNRSVREVFELAGFLPLFGIEPSREQALARLERQA
jgi:anti-anti-sigma factor